MTNAQRSAERTKAVSLVALQADMVRTKYIEKGKFDHGAIARLVHTVQQIKRFMRVTYEDKERLAGRFGAAGEEAAIVQLVDGKLFLSGTFDVKELAKTIIW